MEIIWYEKAKDDLVSYQRNSLMSKEKVEKYVDKIIEQIDNLQIFPEAGKIIFYEENTEIRQLIYKLHRILYTIRNNEIQIISIICTSQDFDSNILNKIFNKYFKL